MAPPLIVVVFAAAIDASDPSAQAMTVATSETLGPGTLVVVRAVPTNPSDTDAIAIETSVHASAVVELVWPDADRHRAKLRVHVAGNDAWTERELSFGPADPPLQRGRAMALSIASMVPSTVPDAVKLEGPPSPPPPPTAPIVAPPKVEAPPPPPTRSMLALDLLGLGALGLGSASTRDLGGEAALRWRVSSILALRLGAGARAGAFAGAGATLTTTRLAAGLAWTALEGRLGSIGLRSDLVVLHHRLVRTGESSDARFQPAAALALEGAWSPTSAAHFVGAVGVEQAFGTSDVLVDDVRVASLPRTHLVLELGLRAVF